MCACMSTGCAVPMEARRDIGFLAARDAWICELCDVGFCDAGSLLEH